MFPPKQRMLLLKLNDRAVLTPHDYLFPVSSRSSRRAADLRVGDVVYAYDNQLVAITAITVLGEQPILAYAATNEPPYYQASLILQGTLVLTAEGCRRIEHLRPGDRILSGDAAPDPIHTGPWLDDRNPCEPADEIGVLTRGSGVFTDHWERREEPSN